MTNDELLSAWASLTETFPNAEQRTVMDYIDGPLWVIAGPGTGKTSALILRCLSLLCVHHVPPEAIVLTTFTRKVAEELEQRLQEALLRLSTVFPELRSVDISRMRLGTLNSLCWNILTDTPESRFRHLRSLTALDQAFFVYTQSRFCAYETDSETEKLFLHLLSWVDKKSYKVLPPRWLRVKKFTAMYERLINDQVDRARFSASSPAFRMLVQLVEEYEAVLDKYHFTDQTLLLHQTLDILRSPQGRAVVESIHYVIVDEYQDTNPLQAAIYRALAAIPPHHLCVVGDDDQALFRFRGGTVGCMVRFPDECKQDWTECEVTPVSLTETYRSHPAIVDWINGYITTHPQMALPNARVQKKLPLRAQPSLAPTAPVLWAIRGKTKQEVATNFLEVVQTLKKQGVIESYAQCALLAHSLKPSTEAGAYIRELQSHGVPVTVSSLSKDQLVYQQILGTLLLALDRFGNFIPVNSNGKYVSMCRKVAENTPVLALMARQITTWLTTDPHAARQMSLTILAQRILNAQPCIDLIENDPASEQAAHSLIQTLDSYDRVVRHGWTIQMEEVQGGKRVKKEWMQQVYSVLVEGIQQEHLERGENMRETFHPDAMTVLTIHKAKGLEFPVVAVVVDKQNSATSDSVHRLEQDVLPFRQDLVREKDLTPTFLLGGDAEARAVQDIVRLHYVAYSRAKSVLLFLILDEHLEAEPPALGIGADAAWFRQQVEVWPPQQKKVRKSKRTTNSANEEGEQHGFEW